MPRKLPRKIKVRLDSKECGTSTPFVRNEREFVFPTRKSPWIAVRRTKSSYKVGGVFDKEGYIKEKELTVKLFAGRKKKGQTRFSFRREKRRIYDPERNLIRKEKGIKVDKLTFEPLTEPNDRMLVSSQRDIYDKQTRRHFPLKRKKKN
jgi:ribosomal protein S8